jgi:polyisoprenoid-binding protein YceI
MPHLPGAQHPTGDRLVPTPEVWRAGPPDSEIRFQLRHLVVTEIQGRVTRWRADLRLDFQRPDRSSVEVVADAASVETGVAERDQHVQSAELLDVKTYPEIRFRSREVRPQGQDRYEIVGDLTIRGITRQATLALVGEPREGADAATVSFTGRATVNRQEFGLHWNQDLDAGGVLVGDRIDLQVTLKARRRG